MWRSSGLYLPVTTAGVPVRLTALQSDPTARVVCHTIFVQQHADNVGKLYLCSLSNANKTTGLGILATIPAPTLSSGVAVILPWATYTIPYAPGGGNLADYYLDADSSLDKATVSFVRA